MKRAYTLLLGAGLAHAQSIPTPYTAHYREYGVTLKSGKLTSFSLEGTKACNSQGQIFEAEFQAGTTQYSTEKLYEPGRHTQYVINLSSKSAISRPADIKPFTPPAFPPIGAEVVNGVATTVYPITNGKNGSQDGKIWVSNGTNIVVKIFINLPNGQTYGYELSELNVGREPDAALFQAPAGITLPH